MPINPAGKLPGGSAFEDIDSLKAVLLEQEEALAREMTEALLAYALGRTIEFSDADDIDLILDSLKAQQFRVRSMIHQIAASDVFRMK